MSNKIPPPPPMTHKILKNNTIEIIMSFIKKYFIPNLQRNTKALVNY